MLNNNFLNKIVVGDVLNVLPQIAENSIDLVLTDPPYFLDKLDNGWKPDVVNSGKNQQIVKSLPAGMKFDRNQGLNFYNWYLSVAKAIMRVLKPGGFFFSFSSPRLYHRMASAIDDSGFLLRDCFLWLYTQNQAKAMGLNHFIEKMNSSQKGKEQLKKELDGWKTPQVKSCFEPIAVAQKPTEGTFLNNILKHKVGLLNVNLKVGSEMFPANVLTSESANETLDKVFLVPKPKKEEKGFFNKHITVKPLHLCEYLIKLAVFNNKGVVLDPFLGSGTTAVAAKRLGFHYIGVDINKEYVEVAKKRLEKISPGQTSSTSSASQVSLFCLPSQNQIF